MEHENYPQGTLLGSLNASMQFLMLSGQLIPCTTRADLVCPPFLIMNENISEVFDGFF